MMNKFMHFFFVLLEIYPLEVGLLGQRENAYGILLAVSLEDLYQLAFLSGMYGSICFPTALAKNFVNRKYSHI